MTNAILLHRTMQAVLTFAGCVALTGGVLAEPAAEARQPKGHLRLDRSKLLIGTWWLEPQFQDEAHVRDMADCGIEFLVGSAVKPEALDDFAKYGVGVVQKYFFPFWWSGRGENGQMATLNPISTYAECLKKFKDHPAVVGFDLGDEPSSIDFEHFGKVAAYVARQLPDKFVFVNLFPNYAAEASLTREEALTQLGTRDYTTYIRKYCKAFSLDYLSFDSYIWGWGNTPSVLFENLRVVTEACAGTGRSLWVTLQVNSYRSPTGELRGPMTENRLRYQANVALAFGAESIIWACWGNGWWEGNVINTNGVKTAQYDRLRTVNGELRRIGGEYMKYRRITTDLVDFDDDSADGLRGVAQKSVASGNGAAFRGVRALDKTPLAVGHMVARDASGGHAMLVTSCDDPHDRHGVTHEVAFRAPGRRVRAFDGNGECAVTSGPDGRHTFALKSNHAVLVETEDIH